MKITPVTLKEIAALINARFVGDENHIITGFNEIHRVSPGDVVFVDHPKYYDKALNSVASTILINQKIDCPPGKALVIHNEPFTAFNDLTKHFQPRIFSKETISTTAKIGKNVIIMPGCYIGNKVIIGDNTILYPNVVIYDHSEVGSNVVIHANTTIGSDAFYFKKREKGFEPLNSCGYVVIEDNVVIGANCTIDRGVTSITKIGKGTILDNQIHVGHDVEIGEMCLFAAQTGIAGCVSIGNRVTVWGQVGISSSIKIEDGATILAQSGVGENVGANQTVFGSPAGPARDKMREIFALKKLPELLQKFYKG